MNVTGWDIASKMKLPDYCFGNQDVCSAYTFNNGPFTFVWAISEAALPDPCCIWQVGFTSMPTTDGTGHLRIGLADAVPTTEAEMNAAVEIFPGLGDPHVGPNRIQFYAAKYVFFTIDCRKGLVTGGKKLVIENYCVKDTMRLVCNLVVSGLPTKVPGWPGAWPAG